MTDSHQKKKANDTHPISPVAAGIAGIVAGGAAVVAAVIMGDKKNQKKVKEALVGAKEKVTEYIEKNTQKIKDKV